MWSDTVTRRQILHVAYVFIVTRECRLAMRSGASLFLSVWNALTPESFDFEFHFRY